jgi:hypothetical protein
MVTMREALKQIGVSKGVNAFMWEESKQGVNSHLAQQFKYGRRQNYLNDLLEYCWLAYSKSRDAPGAMLIGRTGDLWVTQHLQRSGISVKDHQTLWDPHTKGNIQVLDKWAPVVNDCWVLGGIHRCADFELVSVRSLQNLWDYNNGFHIVTAREILGLLNFGYSVKQEPKGVKLVCTHPGKARESTIQAYARFMAGKERAGPNSIRSLLAMDPALKNEIHGFDRSRLKHIVPPR